MSPDTEAQIRSYAAGEISWGAMKAKGITNYLDVLAGLHELGLRPPTASAKVQAAGCEVLRRVLEAQAEDAPV